MCLCYVNKAAFGKPSGHLRRGLIARKVNCEIRGLELSVPDLYIQKGGWGLETEFNRQGPMIYSIMPV